MVTQRYHFIKTKQDNKRIDTELTYILEVMLELNFLFCNGEVQRSLWEIRMILDGI